MKRPPLPGDSFDDNFDGTSGRPIGRLMTRIAHALRWALPVMILLRVLSYFDYDSAFSRWIAEGFIWIFAVILFVAIFHQNAPRLCVSCMEEVPENAAEVAERRQLFLWFEHRHALYPLLAWVPLLVVCAISTVGVTVYDDTFLGEVVLRIPNDLYLFAMVYALWIHHRLRPWCPYCRDWDDDGPTELVPDPDPADSKKIPR